MVEEIDSWNAHRSFVAVLGRPARLTMHCEPFIEIFAFWKLDGKTQVPGALSRVNMAHLRWMMHKEERTNVASAYFLSWYCFVPSGTSLRGLKVRVFPLSNGKSIRIEDDA